MTNYDSANVTVIDAASSAVTDTVAVGNNPQGIAYDGTNVYVTNKTDDTVSVISAASKSVVDTVTVGADPISVAAGGGKVWVANSGDDTVSVIDPANSFAVTTVTVGDSPEGVVFDGVNIYVTNRLSNNMSVIDPATETVTTTVAAGTSPTEVLYDGTYLWIVNNRNSVRVTNPTTGAQVAMVPTLAGIRGLAYDGNYVYVSRSGIGQLDVISPLEYKVAGSIVNTIGAFPFGIVFTGANIFVANQNSDTVSKLTLF